MITLNGNRTKPTIIDVLAELDAFEAETMTTAKPFTVFVPIDFKVLIWFILFELTSTSPALKNPACSEATAGKPVPVLSDSL